jgi:hypothetical protein
MVIPDPDFFPDLTFKKEKGENCVLPIL